MKKHEKLVKKSFKRSFHTSIYICHDQRIAHIAVFAHIKPPFIKLLFRHEARVPAKHFSHKFFHCEPPLLKVHTLQAGERYCQVLCANSFTSLAELSLHRAGQPALNYLVAEGRERVKGGEAACEALDVHSVFCYQPASSSCISMCFMLMYFFPPHWVPAT